MNTLTMMQKPAAVRWYREPWVWLVLGGPLAVICASIYTIVLAFQGADRVVAEDYYRQGLSINKDLRRDSAARLQGIAGSMTLDRANGAISFKLEGGEALPSVLLLTVSRPPSRGNTDTVTHVRLVQLAPGRYAGALQEIKGDDAMTSWHVKVEAPDWRLTGEWADPMHTGLRLKAAQ